MFLWGKFIETPSLPSYTQIYQLDLKLEPYHATVTENVAHRQKKSGAGAYQRWDNATGIAIGDPMVADTARGTEFLLPPDTNYDLYRPPSQEFLIGAVRASLNWGMNLLVSLDTAAPGGGIAMRYIGGEDIPDPPVVPGLVYIVPEPNSGLLSAVLATLGYGRGRRRAAAGAARACGSP